MLERMRAALAAGEAFQGEAVNYRKDGSAYVVEWLITPLRDADGCIVRWVSAQRDITERRAYEDRQALMVRELHHRVKNTLATVQAVLNATVRSSLTIPEFTRALSGRIASLARTHALITEDVAQAASFDGLLRAELDPYGERGRLTLEGPRVVLPSELAVPFGMALHELTTNCLRHGSLADPNGRLNVTWWIEEGPSGRGLRWDWAEHDGPPVGHPTREGFGHRLLTKVLATQTGAEVAVDFAPDGLRVCVRMPLSRPAPEGSLRSAGPHRQPRTTCPRSRPRARSRRNRGAPSTSRGCSPISRYQSRPHAISRASPLILPASRTALCLACSASASSVPSSSRDLHSSETSKR